MFRLVEALNGRLIGSNLGIEMFGFETHEQSIFCSTDCLG